MPNTSPSALASRDIRCMLFDLGDTLWRRGETATWDHLEDIANLRAVALLRARVEPARLPALDDVTLGQHLRQTFEAHVRDNIRAQPTIEPDGAQAAIEGLREWGIADIDRSFGEAIYESLRIRIPESRPLFEDTLSTLVALQQRGYRLGIVTNRIHGGPPFQQDLHTLGLDRFFRPEAIAVSSDLGLRKPHPGMFLHALKGLDARPEETLMVGDSLAADIIGAQGLGIFAVWKRKKKIPKRDYFERYLRGEIAPDLIIDHLRELLEIFQGAGTQ